MYRINRTLTLKYLLIIFLLIPFIYGQKPTAKDYYRTVAELGIFLYLQYGIHMNISDLEQMNRIQSTDIFEINSDGVIQIWKRQKKQVISFIWGLYWHSSYNATFSKDDYMSMLLQILRFYLSMGP